jgi:hypothetical protein
MTNVAEITPEQKGRLVDSFGEVDTERFTVEMKAEVQATTDIYEAERTARALGGATVIEFPQHRARLDDEPAAVVVAVKPPEEQDDSITGYEEAFRVFEVKILLGPLLGPEPREAIISDRDYVRRTIPPTWKEKLGSPYNIIWALRRVLPEIISDFLNSSNPDHVELPETSPPAEYDAELRRAMAGSSASVGVRRTLAWQNRTFNERPTLGVENDLPLLPIRKTDSDNDPSQVWSGEHSKASNERHRRALAAMVSGTIDIATPSKAL